MANRLAEPAEPFVQEVTRVVGGVWGRHASRAYNWVNPATVAVGLGTIVWLLAIVRQIPCRRVPGVAVNDFYAQCYSDIPVLFVHRGLMDGYTPLLDAGAYPVLEYPALTGWLMELNRLVTGWLGAPVGPGLSDVDQASATNLFVAVNMVVLFVLWLITIFAQLGATRGRGWDALMLAASPCVVLTGLINWDMLPLALTALGVFFWARRRPGWAGLFLGLSMAAKLYAGLLLGPLLLLCLRSGRMREFGRTFGLFVVGWLAANLPTIVLAPTRWAQFWSFNADRGGDFGSLWYLFALNGTPIANLNIVSGAAFAVGCLAVGALTMFAPKRPRLAQVFFLVLMAFLMTNKVYSPQYVLWILPFIAMCRPRWRDWIIFTVGEWLYVMAIWGHLGQYLQPGSGGPDKIFWAATILRLATQAWLVVAVIRDVLNPDHDLVRISAPGSPYRDDPAGGVLDGAPDVAWVKRLQSWVPRSFASVRARLPARGKPGTPLPGVAYGLDRWDRGGLSWVGGAWAVSRLLLAAVAVTVAVSQGLDLLGVLDNWDAEHYLAIAREGYVTTGDDAKRMAFFPGLPLLLAPFMAIGVPGQIVGVVVSLICSAVAAAALYRMGGLWAAGLWLIAPTAVFTFVPYSEAFFCAFAFWAWERARSDRWAQAALLAAGACSVRVSGLFLLGALGVMILTWRMPDGTSMADRLLGWLRRAVWLLIPAATAFAYIVYLYVRTGSWTAWYAAQEAGWAREWTSPVAAIRTTIDVIASDMYDSRPGWDTVFTFELVSFAVGLVAVGWLVRRRMWAEMTWIAIQLVAFSTSQWLFSVNRAVLLWFPVWIIAAELVAYRPRTATGRVAHRAGVVGWVGVSVITMMWWAQMFYRGQWAS